ncbi:MAG: hypothetical protein PV340_05160 [Wolbachia sp.]|nr:hypothetical protein [Wolbachia sp.]MDD9336214.1 hypothetical protein [Wolbachia sp.]
MIGSQQNKSAENLDDFIKQFSFLKNNSIPEAYINSTIGKGKYKKYRKLIEDYNTTFVVSQENSSPPLHLAVTCSKSIDLVKETICAVLQSGIDINHRDKEGNTPLMCLLNKAIHLEKKYDKIIQ